jgi:3-oxo-5alpha-steroid 4-dehydrogenase
MTNSPAIPIEAPVRIDGESSLQCDDSCDVLVAGFGASGACAAIEAASAGAEVIAIDGFPGGGATTLSGGVIYAGGGTRFQKAAGYDDSPEAMPGEN